MTILTERDRNHVFEQLRKGLVPERGIEIAALERNCRVGRGGLVAGGSGRERATRVPGGVELVEGHRGG